MIFFIPIRCMLLICILLLAPPCVFAKPASVEQRGYTVITAPELKEMIRDEKVVVIHALSQIEYEIQHIEGSINIPVVEMATTDKLPTDKSTPVVFYCMGKR